MDSPTTPDHEIMDDAARSVVVAVNPTSGATNSDVIVNQLVQRLTEVGLEPETISDIQEIPRRASELRAENRLRAVVAAGGDGTVSMLANNLDRGTPIAVLPLGTENLMAKFLELTPSVEKVTEIIMTGRTVQLDAGRANGQLFLVVASCGFDADVVTRLHASRTGHIRHWSYAIPVLAAIRRYKYPKLRIFVDDESVKLTTRWAFVFNVPRYAMNLPIASDARATDGLLDLCTFGVRSLAEGIATLGAILLRRHRNLSQTKAMRFKNLRMESDQPVPYQLDGDPGGVLPLEITVDPGCLTMLVSESWPT